MGLQDETAHGAPGGRHTPRAQFPREHFRGCPGIVRRALHYGQVSYRSVDRILRRNADRLPLEGEAERPDARTSELGNLLGDGYDRNAGRSERNGGGPSNPPRRWAKC